MKIQSVLTKLNKKTLFPSFKDENHYYFYLKSNLTVRVKREKDSEDDVSIIAKSIPFDNDSEEYLATKQNWDKHDGLEFLKTIPVPMTEISDMLPMSLNDGSRYVLNGVYFNESGMACTDGKRLILKKNCPDFARCDGHIFSNEHLKEFKSLFGTKPILEIQVTDDVFYKLEYDGVEIQGKFVDGVYPNFLQVIPKNKSGNHFRFSDKLLGLYKEISSTYGKKTEVYLNSRDSKIIIYNENKDEIKFDKDLIEVERGEYPKFQVDMRYLNDFLKIGMFDFFIEDEHSPLCLTNDEYEGVLMPMRIK